MPTDAFTLTETAHHLTTDAADLLFREARTVNTFTEREVSDETIQAVYDLVRWGPTAMNTSPLRLLIVRSGEARARLAHHMSPGNRLKTLHAPLTLVIAADDDFHESLPRLAPHIEGAREMFAGSSEHRTAMARDNGFLQAGYLIVGLRGAGLHVGPMTGFDAAAVDGEFFATTAWRSLIVANVGHGPAAHPEVPLPATYPRQDRLGFDEAAQTI